MVLCLWWTLSSFCYCYLLKINIKIWLFSLSNEKWLISSHEKKSSDNKIVFESLFTRFFTGSLILLCKLFVRYVDDVD